MIIICDYINITICIIPVYLSLTRRRGSRLKSSQGRQHLRGDIDTRIRNTRARLTAQSLRIVGACVRSGSRLWQSASRPVSHSYSHQGQGDETVSDDVARVDVHLKMAASSWPPDHRVASILGA